MGLLSPAAAWDGASGDGASAGGHASDRSPFSLLPQETGECLLTSKRFPSHGRFHANPLTMFIFTVFFFFSFSTR